MSTWYLRIENSNIPDLALVKPMIFIGNEDSDINIGSESMKEQHAALFYTEETKTYKIKVFSKDHQMTVNGQVISNKSYLELYEGDKIQFSSDSPVYFITQKLNQEPPAPPSPAQQQQKQIPQVSLNSPVQSESFTKHAESHATEEDELHYLNQLWENSPLPVSSSISMIKTTPFVCESSSLSSTLNILPPPVLLSTSSNDDDDDDVEVSPDNDSNNQEFTKSNQSEDSLDDNNKQVGGNCTRDSLDILGDTESSDSRTNEEEEEEEPVSITSALDIVSPRSAPTQRPFLLNLPTSFHSPDKDKELTFTQTVFKQPPPAQEQPQQQQENDKSKNVNTAAETVAATTSSHHHRSETFDIPFRSSPPSSSSGTGQTRGGGGVGGPSVIDKRANGKNRRIIPTAAVASDCDAISLLSSTTNDSTSDDTMLLLQAPAQIDSLSQQLPLRIRESLEKREEEKRQKLKERRDRRRTTEVEKDHVDYQLVTTTNPASQHAIGNNKTSTLNKARNNKTIGVVGSGAGGGSGGGDIVISTTMKGGRGGGSAAVVVNRRVQNPPGTKQSQSNESTITSSSNNKINTTASSSAKCKPKVSPNSQKSATLTRNRSTVGEMDEAKNSPRSGTGTAGSTMTNTNSHSRGKGNQNNVGNSKKVVPVRKSMSRSSSTTRTGTTGSVQSGQSGQQNVNRDVTNKSNRSSLVISDSRRNQENKNKEINKKTNSHNNSMQSYPDGKSYLFERMYKGEDVDHNLCSQELDWTNHPDVISTTTTVATIGAASATGGASFDPPHDLEGEDAVSEAGTYTIEAEENDVVGVGSGVGTNGNSNPALLVNETNFHDEILDEALGLNDDVSPDEPLRGYHLLPTPSDNNYTQMDFELKSSTSTSHMSPSSHTQSNLSTSLHHHNGNKWLPDYPLGPTTPILSNNTHLHHPHSQSHLQQQQYDDGKKGIHSLQPSPAMSRPGLYEISPTSEQQQQQHLHFHQQQQQQAQQQQQQHYQQHRSSTVSLDNAGRNYSTHNNGAAAAASAHLSASILTHQQQQSADNNEWQLETRKKVSPRSSFRKAENKLTNNSTTTTTAGAAGAMNRTTTTITKNHPEILGGGEVGGGGGGSTTDTALLLQDTETLLQDMERRMKMDGQQRRQWVESVRQTSLGDSQSQHNKVTSIPFADEHYEDEGYDNESYEGHVDSLSLCEGILSNTNQQQRMSSSSHSAVITSESPRKRSLPGATVAAPVAVSASAAAGATSSTTSAAAGGGSFQKPVKVNRTFQLRRLQATSGRTNNDNLSSNTTNTTASNNNSAANVIQQSSMAANSSSGSKQQQQHHSQSTEVPTSPGAAATASPGMLSNAYHLANRFEFTRQQQQQQANRIQIDKNLGSTGGVVGGGVDMNVVDSLSSSCLNNGGGSNGQNSLWTRRNDGDSPIRYGVSPYESGVDSTCISQSSNHAEEIVKMSSALSRDLESLARREDAMDHNNSCTTTMNRPFASAFTPIMSLSSVDPTGIIPHISSPPHDNNNSTGPPPTATAPSLTTTSLSAFRSRSVAQFSDNPSASNRQTQAAYDGLLVSSILQLSQKLLRCSTEIVTKMRCEYTSPSPSPTTEETRGKANELGPDVSQQDLYQTLKNMKYVELHLQTLDRTIFPQHKSGRNSAVGSCSEIQYLQERDRIQQELQGFRPLTRVPSDKSAHPSIMTGSLYHSPPSSSLYASGGGGGGGTGGSSHLIQQQQQHRLSQDLSNLSLDRSVLRRSQTSKPSGPVKAGVTRHNSTGRADQPNVNPRPSTMYHYYS